MSQLEAEEATLAMDTFDQWVANLELPLSSGLLLNTMLKGAWMEAWNQCLMRGCDKTTRIMHDFHEEGKE